MSEATARDRISEAVTAWPGVEAVERERGEFSLRYRGRELGHLHGHRVAHFSFPREVGEALRQAGRVGPHPVAPRSVKWAARSIRDAEDEAEVVALMRLNYERLIERTADSQPSGAR